jgi:hypothetical protein
MNGEIAVRYTIVARCQGGSSEPPAAGPARLVVVNCVTERRRYRKSLPRLSVVRPNRRAPAARWDTYLYVPDPDALAAEFASRNVEFSEPLKDTHDGLRGFDLKDCDGYVLFFGRPRS